MATLKMINKAYTGNTAYFYVLRYISESSRFLGGIVPQLAAVEMQAVESEYNDDPEANVLYHLIFCFCKSDKMSENDICLLCNRIAKFYGKYQAVFAVEKVKSSTQLHVVINAFSFIDGEQLFINKAGLQDLVMFCVPFIPRCTIE